jgi:hypothetical protein
MISNPRERYYDYYTPNTHPAHENGGLGRPGKEGGKNGDHPRPRYEIRRYRTEKI